MDVRELLGYTPWFFALPPSGKGYERAWEQVNDKEGFFAPYDLTTAEQRHPNSVPHMWGMNVNGMDRAGHFLRLSR